MVRGRLLMQAAPEDRLLGFEIKSDGTRNACLNLAFRPELRELIPGVTLTQGKYQYITMNGREVYRFAIDRVPDAIDKVIYKANSYECRYRLVDPAPSQSTNHGCCR